jgi:hypothetical protein
MDMAVHRIVQRDRKPLAVALRRQPEASEDGADFSCLDFRLLAAARPDQIRGTRDLPDVNLCLVLVTMPEQAIDHNKAGIGPTPRLGVLLVLLKQKPEADLELGRIDDRGSQNPRQNSDGGSEFGTVEIRRPHHGQITSSIRAQLRLKIFGDCALVLFVEKRREMRANRSCELPECSR